jgi:translation initiation factor IF-3
MHDANVGISNQNFDLSTNNLNESRDEQQTGDVQIETRFKGRNTFSQNHSNRLLEIEDFDLDKMLKNPESPAKTEGVDKISLLN